MRAQVFAARWLASVILAVPLLGLFSVQPARAEAPAQEQQTAQYEVKFMQGMIDHHAMAVMMGEMCLDMAVHPELIGLCEAIVATQSQEIQTMQAWLQDWYGISYQPTMPAGHEISMESRVKHMSAQEFEVWFMRTMIRHHKGAIREGERCMARAAHDPLILLCEDIVAAQTVEIERMQQWLCEWYGICQPT